MAVLDKAPNGKIAKFAAMVSTIVSRADVATRAGITFDTKRDLYKQLGYRRTLTFTDYWERYERGGISARIVDAFPTATWRNPPLVTVKNDEGFNEAWKGLAQRLSVFHYLERVDRLAGVGRYSILFLGLRGGRGADKAIQKVKGPEDVLFFSIFSEENAEVRSLEGETSNPRFGLPSFYNVQFLTGVSLNSRGPSAPVHASRVIHVAEGTLEDDIFGTPRLKKVWNYLDDLDKVVGGVAEAVWKTMDRGIQFDLDPDLTLKGEDEEDFEEEIEEYMHGLKRYIKTRGITTTVLGSEVPNPQGPASTILGLISGTSGIPQRILMGSERGELASGQDERNFNSRIRERQISYAEPVILRPLLDRFVDIGALPKPKGDIEIDWPDLAVQTDRERSDIAARLGQAVRNVAEQGRTGVLVIPPKLFATKYLNIDPEEFDKAVAATTLPKKEPPNANPEAPEGGEEE